MNKTHNFLKSWLHLVINNTPKFGLKFKKEYNIFRVNITRWRIQLLNNFLTGIVIYFHFSVFVRCFLSLIVMSLMSFISPIFFSVPVECSNHSNPNAFICLTLFGWSSAFFISAFIFFVYHTFLSLSVAFCLLQWSP